MGSGSPTCLERRDAKTSNENLDGSTRSRGFRRFPFFLAQDQGFALGGNASTLADVEVFVPESQPGDFALTEVEWIVGAERIRVQIEDAQAGSRFEPEEQAEEPDDTIFEIQCGPSGGEEDQTTAYHWIHEDAIAFRELEIPLGLSRRVCAFLVFIPYRHKIETRRGGVDPLITTASNVDEHRLLALQLLESRHSRDGLVQPDVVEHLKSPLVGVGVEAVQFVDGSLQIGYVNAAGVVSCVQKVWIVEVRIETCWSRDETVVRDRCCRIVCNLESP